MRPPSVDKLARSLAATGLPHPICVDLARDAIAADDPDSAVERAADSARTLLQPVVNATGVLLHTNLGRAPWPSDDPGGFRNLELDLSTGERGSRQAHVGKLFARLVDAESAIVVNNCAAAVMLVLAALSDGRRAVVSRGELVEIGGGFRVPDVMAQSGAILHEVGTTNRTRLADYRRALTEHDDVALVMQIHQSNYRISGFTEAATTVELASLDVPLVADIGSGLLDAACPWLDGPPPAWLAGEPAAKQTLGDGAALVMFSGDKLLGGAQAGVIAGHGELVEQCARHPLARAIRPGGHVLGALQSLAMAYLERRGRDIPFWRMASEPLDALERRADALDVGKVVETTATPGGGTLPGVEIASVGVAIPGDRRVELRAVTPPIIARTEGDTTVCDLRTIDPTNDAHVADVLRELP